MSLSRQRTGVYYYHSHDIRTGPDLKDNGYIDNRDTIGLVVTMNVMYLSGHNYTHAVFVLVHIGE